MRKWLPTVLAFAVGMVCVNVYHRLAVPAATRAPTEPHTHTTIFAQSPSQVQADVSTPLSPPTPTEPHTHTTILSQTVTSPSQVQAVVATPLSPPPPPSLSPTPVPSVSIAPTSSSPRAPPTLSATPAEVAPSVSPKSLPTSPPPSPPKTPPQPPVNNPDHRPTPTVDPAAAPLAAYLDAYQKETGTDLWQSFAEQNAYSRVFRDTQSGRPCADPGQAFWMPKSEGHWIIKTMWRKFNCANRRCSVPYDQWPNHVWRKTFANQNVVLIGNSLFRGLMVTLEMLLGGGDFAVDFVSRQTSHFKMKELPGEHGAEDREFLLRFESTNTTIVYRHMGLFYDNRTHPADGPRPAPLEWTNVAKYNPTVVLVSELMNIGVFLQRQAGWTTMPPYTDPTYEREARHMLSQLDKLAALPTRPRMVVLQTPMVLEPSTVPTTKNWDGRVTVHNTFPDGLSKLVLHWNDVVFGVVKERGWDLVPANQVPLWGVLQTPVRGAPRQSEASVGAYGYRDSIHMAPSVYTTWARMVAVLLKDPRRDLKE